jgi:hypothetical protein
VIIASGNVGNTYYRGPAMCEALHLSFLYSLAVSSSFSLIWKVVECHHFLVGEN